MICGKSFRRRRCETNSPNCVPPRISSPVGSWRVQSIDQKQRSIRHSPNTIERKRSVVMVVFKRLAWCSLSTDCKLFLQIRQPRMVIGIRKERIKIELSGDQLRVGRCSDVQSRTNHLGITVPPETREPRKNGIQPCKIAGPQGLVRLGRPFYRKR